MFELIIAMTNGKKESMFGSWEQHRMGQVTSPPI